MGEGNLPVVETTRRIVAAGCDRVVFENCLAYQTRFRDRRGTAVMGEGAFAYCHPPYRWEVCVPNMPYKPAPGEPTIEAFAATHDLDLLALEQAAVTRSVRWLKVAYGDAGITLAKELRPLD
jgi:hypothetical protein